jgi:hypothetical protein
MTDLEALNPRGLGLGLWYFNDAKQIYTFQMCENLEIRTLLDLFSK